MSLRALVRTAISLLATALVAALFVVPSTAQAHVCATCEDPELPPGGGPSCPTIEATTQPEIPVSSTNPKVGQTVSASTGDWNSNAKKLKAYWYVDGSAVGSPMSFPDATNRNVTTPVSAAHLGKTVRLYVRALGTNEQCVEGEYSNATAAVGQGAPPSVVSAPAILGVPTVGEDVNYTSGTWNPAVNSFAYTWKLADTGEVIHAADVYPIAPELAGHTLQLTVTTILSGHADGTATTAAKLIVPGAAPEATVAPSILGTLRFGRTVEVTDGEWSLAPDEVSHQWLRDGEPIAGATSPTYTFGLADVGHQIGVRSTAHRTGYADAVVTAERGMVRLAAAPKWKGAKAPLKGRNKVSKKVRVALSKAKIRTRAQAPGAKVTYQWLRNGKAIKKATTAKYKLVKKDKGKVLKVRITITRPGYQSRTVTTKQVRIRNNGKKIG